MTEAERKRPWKIAEEYFPLDGSEPDTVFEARRRMVAAIKADRRAAGEVPEGYVSRRRPDGSWKTNDELRIDAARVRGEVPYPEVADHVDGSSEAIVTRSPVGFAEVVHPESMRDRVLAKFGGRCAYCGCDLTLKTMQVDHFVPLRRGDPGDKSHLEVFENYFPSCRSCNYYKSTFDVEGLRERIETMIGNLHRQSTVKVLVRFRKVAFVPDPVVFWFERFEEARCGFQS